MWDAVYDREHKGDGRHSPNRWIPLVLRGMGFRNGEDEMNKSKKSKKTGSSVAGGENRRSVEESAYYRWLDRGGAHGRDVDDWLDSEEAMAQNVFDRDPED